MEWTVDRIADALSALSEEVGQGHARLVDFLLEEAEKTAPPPRHLSSVDVFADMKSIALDSNRAPPPGVDTMAVKFKASRWPSSLLRVLRALHVLHTSSTRPPRPAGL